jgi:putative glutamine amidotransferase
MAPDAHPLDVLGHCDGLLLTGGGDIDPALYGEAPHPTHVAAEHHRDALEIELVVRAIERDIPVLAICRGLQVLNVALGGTLIQDIPSQVPHALDHSMTGPYDRVAHDVTIDSESLLAQVLGATPIAPRRPVNSRHHQAIRRLAPDLVISATSADGVIEAVERRPSRFCVAVQWHPENFWRTGEFLPVFAAFVAATVLSRA